METNNSDYRVLKYQCAQDYLYNMEALTSGEAVRLWRQSIKESWHNCCAYCGKPPIDDASLTLDHVKAKSKGGEDLTSNIVPADYSCNASKGSEDWREWYRRQTFYEEWREHRIQHWLDTGIVLNDEHLPVELGQEFQ
jgi:5-methylcytosine-specific restriction endonuclease McrA